MPCGECKWWSKDGIRYGWCGWDAFPAAARDQITIQIRDDDGVHCPQFTPRQEAK